MLAPWQNITVKVQRRPANPARNVLNEPAYGVESTWPVIYAALNVRVEFVDESMRWIEPGERVDPGTLNMYIEPSYTILPLDRVTVTVSDDPTIGTIYNIFIVSTVYPEWDSVGNVHHYIAELSVH